MNNWKPIETAPKDGTPFLAKGEKFCEEISYCVGFYQKIGISCYFCVEGVTGHDIEPTITPTEWMSIPE